MNTPRFMIYRLVKGNLDKVLQADAVYIACTALSTYEAVTYLQEDGDAGDFREHSGHVGRTEEAQSKG